MRFNHFRMDDIPRLYMVNSMRIWKALRYSLMTALGADLVTCLALAWTSPKGGPSFLWLLGLWSLLLLTTAALAIPFIVRWIGDRLQVLSSIFRKQALSFMIVCSFPLVLLLGALSFSGTSLADQRWFLWSWVLGLCGLTFWGVFWAALDLSVRMSDSLRILSNGMEMAARLDFDHPIVTFTRDEFGQTSDTFSYMNSLLKTRMSILRTIFNNIRVFGGLLNEDKILDHALDIFRTLEEAEAIVVALYDEARDELVVKRSTQQRPEIIGLGFYPSEGVLGRVMEDQQFWACYEEEYLRQFQECRKEMKLWGKAGQVLSVPMLFKGRVRGAVTFYGANLNEFQLEAKKDYYQGLANQIAIFLDDARLYGQIARDRLTSFYTHSFIENQLEQLIQEAKRDSSPLSFVMLDVDKFKHINDQYGHPMGNRLLKAVTLVIEGLSKDTDLLGRYGGDEFEILLPNTGREGALAYTEKLRKSIESLEIATPDGSKIGVTISVGFAVFPQDAQGPTHLMAAADKALYEAKARGRNQVAAYEIGREKPSEARSV